MTANLGCFSIRDLPGRPFLLAILTVLSAATLQTQALCADDAALRTSLVRVADLDVGETQDVELCNGRKVSVKLLDLKETRDSVRSAVRRAEVAVEVDGRKVTLVSSNYNLPTTLGSVQIDCSITKGCNGNTTLDHWGLVKDARLRLWPADSPLIEPETFMYPVNQRWFASLTHSGNEPVYADGVEPPRERKIYYHSGEDIGGTEGLVEVVAATDGLVASAGLVVLEGHRRSDDPETPVAERYDVVYLKDNRGWYYRYSHLKEFDPRIVPGRMIRKGDRIGLLGKEGASGGWSHLHFEIKSRQPSGKWGTQTAYPFLWEAYRRQYKPKLVAVARPHHLLFTGESATLDATRSWSASGKVAKYEWQFTDGTKAEGPTVERTYSEPGEYSEILKVTDAEGRSDYDFAIVHVVDRELQKPVAPAVHATYAPSLAIKPGDPVTFTARTFGTTHGKEIWNFGDGTPPVETQSDGNVQRHAKDGYGVTTHRFEKAGHYIVRVERANERGEKGIAHLHVRVGVED